MTYVVASLVERSVSGVSDSSSEAFSNGADLVEVRLDHLRARELSQRVLSDVRKAVRGPAIATLRSTEEGGRSKLRGRARDRALRAIIRSGFEYVDLELARDGRLINELRRKDERPQTIASVHFSNPVAPAEVRKALTRACKSGDFGKVAMPCDDASQALMLAAIGMKRSAAGDRFILIGMGDQGQLTRVCARQMGSSMVYCSLGKKKAAPGQFDLQDQAAIDLDERHILGLIGHPVSHSVSKPMQEAALARAGLAGTFLNLDMPLKSVDKRALETLRGLGFSGLNVTIPHKETVHSLCDRLDPEATATGAVNTIRFESGLIHGKNTDVIGFTKAIEQKRHIDERTSALIVGAGGAARAAAFALMREGAHVTLAARSPKKAAGVADDLGVDTVTIASLKRLDPKFDVVVNCTPLGTKGVGGASPVPARLFKRGVLLFDMVYNPLSTRTMRLAASKKATAVGGLEMLVQQGAEAFNIWTGAEPDIAAMRVAARRALS